MDKAVKCLLVNVDTVIITEIVEVGSELGEPDCKIIKPYKVDSEGNLTPWLTVTDQTEMMIHSSNILTIVDPTQEIIEKYLTLTE
jgi:hypothetical protein